MKTSAMDRIGSWSVLDEGIVKFSYSCDGTMFVFYVCPDGKQDALREIGNLAANPDSPISWDDAAYLTSLIREVMDMQPQFGAPCDCEKCVPNTRGDLGWQLMMFVCSAALMATFAMFVLWGAM